MFFLIGHRGVGKTSLSKKIDSSIDLDDVISQSHNISKVFAEEGEAEFRKIEKKILKKILSENKVEVISLGAGFELDSFEFPKNSKFIWIQRASDSYGRIFLNRPRLDSKVSALEEFRARKVKRDKLFSSICDFRLSLEEGDFELTEPVKILNSLISGALEGQKRGFFTPQTHFELEVFSGNVELRTDHFSNNEILVALKKKCFSKVIVAIRTKEALEKKFLDLIVSYGAVLDLPLEYPSSLGLSLGYSKSECFLSLHSSLDSDELKKIKTDLHIKWAPIVHSLSDALKIYQDLDENVSFLPRSVESGKNYKWLRLLRSNQIEFYRYGETKHLDQPLYFESFDFKKENIGAVLGENTELSWSPATHRSYFKNEFDSHYLNISIQRDELSDDFLFFLKKQGLRFFSITSPFKKFFACKSSLESCNTYDLKTNEGADTDSKSVEKWSLDLLDKGYDNILIWGSGSMGSLFKNKLKNNAVLASSRMKLNHSEAVFEALIWASGTDSAPPDCVLSQKEALKVVYDLDYKEESGGRLLALETGALYIPGKEFFMVQAMAQREFFRGCFKNS